MHLKLVWPDIGGVPSAANEWKQVTNPVTASGGGVEGYEVVDVQYAGSNWGGLERSGISSFLDGSVGTDGWWFAVGTAAVFQGGIPGPDLTVVQSVELYAICLVPAFDAGWQWLAPSQLQLPAALATPGTHHVLTV